MSVLPAKEIVFSFQCKIIMKFSLHISLTIILNLIILARNLGVSHHTIMNINCVYNSSKLDDLNK